METTTNTTERQITFDNYYKHTTGDFTPVPRELCVALLDHVKTQRRKREENRNWSITIGGKTYRLMTTSINRRYGRSFSYYFKAGTDEVLRISNHWGSCGVPEGARRPKLKCGFVGNCSWDCPNGWDHKFSYRPSCERYPMDFIGGIIKLSDLKSNR